ncbi:diketogulonate reductase-like aldo/keto reductase [Methylobacterium aerolatum]|uniref:Diketogulonate reductase-like aldo/keto reductase n=2 Tax=Methylobacterium aerolatum TaxID=418708 RepID=A0ABU0HZM4_9HYPH|nr:diketogulonate reductase-like aldo/keto reductase [Methylobacterium aerolatum]
MPDQQGVEQGDVEMRAKGFGAARVSVPVIGQGTWRIDTFDRSRAIQALRAGIDAGMTHIDTAEMYGDAEVMVAEAIADCREEIFLVSKVVPSNATRRGVVRACEASLRRLGTDRLDCYLLHWRGSHPLAETIAGFEDLRQAGKILSWGVSNFDVPDLEEALAIAGPDRIACNQVYYSPSVRAIEHAVLPWCTAHGVALVGYSPFGSGDFPEPASSGGRVLQGIAEAHGVSPHSVVLAFLLRLPNVFTIPKTARADRAVENAAAADIQLNSAEIALIESEFPRGPKPRILPML